MKFLAHIKYKQQYIRNCSNTRWCLVKRNLKSYGMKMQVKTLQSIPKINFIL